MSKFKDLNVVGGPNQFGDNGVQNNTTTHNHYHRNGSQSSEGEGFFAAAAGLLVGLAVIIWWFFSHIDQVYYYLNILSLSSGALSLVAVLILMLTGTIAEEDIIRFLCSVFVAVSLFGLAIVSREHAPDEVIRLSQQVKIKEFWGGLNALGKDIVIANFISAAAIGVSAIFSHLGSFRQFAYSMANQAGAGFWYSVYTKTRLFRMRVIAVAFTILSGVVWAALEGEIT